MNAPKTDLKITPKYVAPATAFVLFYVFCWWVGILKWVLGWAVLHWVFTPFLGIRPMFDFILRAFRKYPQLDFSFNISIIGFTICRVLFYYPLGTLFWYIDEFLYPDYKNVKIEKPLFLLGQPRSGTTKLEALLDNDPQLYCLKTHEIILPFIFIQKFFAWAAEFDSKNFNGAITKAIQARVEFNTKETMSGKMRPLKLEKPEEDDYCWGMWFNLNIIHAAFYPDAEGQELSHCFSKHDLAQRERMKLFHRRLIQRSLYFNGKGRQYMAKWVMGWNGEVQALPDMYPDAQYVVIVRDVQQSVPSWVKLIGLLAYDFTGANFVDLKGEARDKFIQLTAQGYHEAVKFCKSIPSNQIHFLKFDEFYADMPGQTKQFYEKFGRTFTPEFEAYLKSEQEKQTSFVGTKLDFSQISKEEIDTLFPDLVKAFWPEK